MGGDSARVRVRVRMEEQNSATGLPISLLGALAAVISPEPPLSNIRTYL